MRRGLLLAGFGLLALVAGARMPAAPPAALATGPGGLPVAGSLLLPVPRPVLTQGFGCTSFELEPLSSQCPGRHFHSGLDLAVPQGTPVRAAAAGTVLVAGWNAAGYGYCVVLDHGHGLTTLYAHLLETAVAAGDVVAAGRPVGLAGSTGSSTGPHLHFEVRAQGRPADPEPLLAALPTRGGTQ